MSAMIAPNSVTLLKYKSTIKRLLKLSFPHLSDRDFEDALDYSINKRYYESKASVYNNYINRRADYTLLELTDYINSREPICTTYGVLFRRHGTVPNPMMNVVQGFLDKRKQDKDMMFTFPKGSEMFEKYNLLQQLDKIDANGIYGILGLYVSLMYNLHVAPSITAQGRSLIASATMCMEMFLANNVQFGSVNEVVVFIDNVRQERHNRKFNDYEILDADRFINAETCFAKLVMTCGYRWIPNEEELDIIWGIVRNLDQEDLNRVYYKNNLYEFMMNSSMIRSIKLILSGLERPYMNPVKPPQEIKGYLDVFSELLMEYVYYGYQIIDRVDRCDNMIKSICLISDTDSTFISMDPWYRFVLEYVKDMDFNILHQRLDVIKYIDECNKEGIFVPQDATNKNLPIEFMKFDEFGDLEDNDWNKAIIFDDPVRDYDFFNDEVIERYQAASPLEIIPQNNLRYSIMNIMAYVIDKVINAYMINFTKESHSYRGDDQCKIIMKNEFTNRVTLLTMAKKNYAAVQEVQEGNFLGEKGVLDVKGMAAIVKSSMSEFTRKELKKILYEDILMDENIDQLKIIKHMAILEKKIYNSLINGSREFYKPLVIKSMSNYEDPMRIQGIKASVAWNEIRDKNLTAIDLTERNSIDIIKVVIDITTLQQIKDDFPGEYERALKLVTAEPLLNNNKKRSMYDPGGWFKGQITAIAIPKDVETPKWILPLINYNEIVNDNLSGFPLESIGISKLDGRNNVNYTNMLKL